MTEKEEVRIYLKNKSLFLWSDGRHRLYLQSLKNKSSFTGEMPEWLMERIANPSTCKRRQGSNPCLSA